MAHQDVTPEFNLRREDRVEAKSDLEKRNIEE